MKKIFLAFMMIFAVYDIAICCPCTENSKIETEENFVPHAKRYIEPEQIAISSNKIFIKVEEDQIVETLALHSDEKGFYVDDDDCDERSGYRWSCLICHFCNAFWDQCCLRCNRDKKGDKCK